MPRQWRVKVGEDREWLVGSILEWKLGEGEVIIPLDQIDGMTQEEIGATVLSLVDEAGLAVALEVADFMMAQSRLRFSDPDFEKHHVLVMRYEGRHELIDRALERMDAIVAIEVRRRKQEEAKAEPGYIYVIKSGPYYKIGMTKQLDKRIQALAIQLPEKLKVVFTVHVKDMRRHEQRLHEWFKAKRLNGEWFALTQCDINAIGELYSSR